MVTYYVKLNEIYTITATDECRVYNASGVQVATCPANESINVKAATAKLKLSDDNAAIKKAVSESGGGTSEECEQHIANADIHTTTAEKLNCSTHIANSDIHVTSAEKTKIANAAQLNSINKFTTFTSFTGNVEVGGLLAVQNKAPLLRAGVDVLPLGTKTALGADAYGLHVSASGGLQLFGTHFMIGDPFSDTALKIVNPELAVYSSDTAAIGFDYANNVIFRSMPNDGTEGTYEIQCWQWEDESHTSKKEAGVKLLKASQVSELEDYSVLNKAELDARYMSSDGGTINGDLVFDVGSKVTFTADCKGVTFSCPTTLAINTKKPTHTAWNNNDILNKEECDGLYARLNSANNFRAINQFHMPLYANSDFYASGQSQFNGTTTFNGEVFFDHITDGYQNLDFCETIELGFVSHATCEARYVFKADSGYVQIKKPNCKAFEDQSVLNKSENDTLYAPKTYDTKNGILITDSNGNVAVSTVISVAELNTLNNNLTNISTKLADLEARLAALEA